VVVLPQVNVTPTLTGNPAASTLSQQPISTRTLPIGGSCDSPMWSRGKTSRSKMTTRSAGLYFLRSVPSVDPPGPPPMMATSYWSFMLGGLWKRGARQCTEQRRPSDARRECVLVERTTPAVKPGLLCSHLRKRKSPISGGDGCRRGPQRQGGRRRRGSG